MEGGKMIVKLNTIHGERELETLNFDPPTMGRFLKGVFERRDINLDEVSRQSGVDLEVLKSILEDDLELDRPTIRKLQAVMPGTFATLMRMQKGLLFYRQYNKLRPSSPIKRRAIARSAKLSTR